MSPEVINSKLELLVEVLNDLKKHVNANSKELVKNHYEIERQVQLCVDISVSIARRIISNKKEISPSSARGVFDVLAKEKIINKALAKKLSDAVGLRNLLVHEYGEIDYSIFFDGLKDGYKSFLKYAEAIEKCI